MGNLAALQCPPNYHCIKSNNPLPICLLCLKAAGRLRMMPQHLLCMFHSCACDLAVGALRFWAILYPRFARIPRLSHASLPVQACCMEAVTDLLP